MGRRYEVQTFAAGHVDDAAVVRAADHRRHRELMPALDAAYEDPAAVRPLIAALLESGATGVFVTADGVPAAYLLAVEREPSWGSNAWLTAPGNGGGDPEAIRTAYAHAAREWVDAGRVSHYVIVNAGDRAIVDAWFRLSFGLQHVHAIREAPVSDPAAHNRRQDLTVRRLERADFREVAELGLVLPRHVAQSPIFSRVPIETIEAMLAELEAEFDDPRFTDLVAVHDGRVVGIAVACALTESPGNTELMRPPNAGFLGHAAVSPEARGFGAGRALGEAVLDWSREQGHEWVGADWRSTNLEADRTWRSLGFRPSFYRLHRLIG